MANRSEQPQPTLQANPARTVLSIVTVPKVIEACATISAKTEGAILELKNSCIQEAARCIDAVQCLGSCVARTNDVEVLRADVHAVNVKLTEVSQDVSELRSSLESFKVEMTALIRSITPSEIASGLPVDDNENAHQPQNGNVLFVTVKHDGEDHHLYLPRSTRDVLLGCIKKRDAVRRILLNFHPVKDLRRFTLTGESSYEKTRLPPLHVKFAEGTVLRLFEPNKALKTIVNDDGTTKYEEEIKSLKAEVRSLITSILEYYFKHYNVDGTKIPEKTANGRKRKAPPQESVRESDVNSGSSQI